MADTGMGIRVRAVFGADAWRLAANDAFGEIVPMSLRRGSQRFCRGVLSMNRMVHGPCAVHKGTGGYKCAGSYGAKGTNAEGIGPTMMSLLWLANSPGPGKRQSGWMGRVFHRIAEHFCKKHHFFRQDRKDRQHRLFKIAEGVIKSR
jgi:hypothetical protein